jgi:hypothetical protein
MAREPCRAAREGGVSDDEHKATLPTSTVQHNIKLDEAILKKEPRDYDAPYFERRYLATLWTTVKSWFQ